VNTIELVAVFGCFFENVFCIHSLTSPTTKAFNPTIIKITMELKQQQKATKKNATAKLTKKTTTMAVLRHTVRSSQKPCQQIELNKSKLSLKEFWIREIIMATQFYDELPLFGTLKISCSLFALRRVNSTYTKILHFMLSL
jgi:hypothetical protein